MSKIVLSYNNSCLVEDDIRTLDNGAWLNDKIIGFVYE